MLRGLDIRDMLIIDRLELEFQPGLNVLTGETGAGKSILLDALGFVLGWRGRSALVRSDAAQGEVVAAFDLSPEHAAHAVLAEAGLPDDDTLILRRTNSKDGRKTAYVNDRRCSGDVLRQLSDTLVELHGQQDDRGLLNPRGHRLLLDQFAGLSAEIEAVKSAWKDLAAARKALATVEAEIAAMRAEEEFLRHAVAELDALDPQPGEEAELDSKRRLMQGAERIREDIAKAHSAVDSAEGQLSDASRWLEGAAAEPGTELDPVLAALSRTLVELDNAQQGVEDCLHRLAFNPLELEEAEERLFAIRGLARKHAVAPDDLAGFGAGLHEKLTRLDQGQGDVLALRTHLQACDEAYAVKAGRLSERRRKAAGALDKAMRAELAPLKLERAVFTTVVESGEVGPSGQDSVFFTISTNPGAPAGPLNKIASGGELSRFLLALKVCLTAGTSGLVMIFDEIDRGVGGATADAVGRRLSALAAEGQVIVVTHSPQVAAQAQHHWRVQKRVSSGQTISSVDLLDAAARSDEIARMLAGDIITLEARAAARALLAG